MLECDICSELMKNSSIINCGHSFCEACIKSWLNTNNTCPSCKVPAFDKDIKKNFLIENLKIEVLTQKSLTEEKNIKNSYVNFNNNNSNIINKNESNISNINTNKIQDTFFGGLKKIFAEYDNFYSKLSQDAKLQIENVLDSNYNLDNNGKRLYNIDDIEKSKYLLYLLFNKLSSH